MNTPARTANSLIIGPSGRGKTTRILSPRILAACPVVIIDTAKEKDGGEFAALIRAAGGEPIRFDPCAEESDRNLLDGTYAPSSLVSDGIRTRHPDGGA